MSDDGDGSRSDGFRMKQLPQAMATGYIHIGTMTGKLNGVMPATTPSGWRTEDASTPVETSSENSPFNRWGMPQANSTTSMPRATSPRASSSTLPCSSVIRRARSSRWRSANSRKANRMRVRAVSDVSRQPAQAPTAPATARSTSASEARATTPVCAPDAGLNTGAVRGSPPRSEKPIRFMVCLPAGGRRSACLPSAGPSGGSVAESMPWPNATPPGDAGAGDGAGVGTDPPAPPPRTGIAPAFGPPRRTRRRIRLPPGPGRSTAGRWWCPPATHAIGDWLFLHGSVASRSLRAAREPVRACVTVTHVDGLVLARSVFEHAVNYRCAMVYGVPEVLTDSEEKLVGLRAISDQVAPGQWEYARSPSVKELAATTVLRMTLDECSVKIRAWSPRRRRRPRCRARRVGGRDPACGRSVSIRWPIPHLAPGIGLPAHLSRDVPAPGSTPLHAAERGHRPG